MNAFAIGGRTRLGVVIGDPVEHTLSPVMHNAAFRALGVDGVYVPMRVAAADLADVLRSLTAIGCLGASITVPHKTSVARLCNRLSASAVTVGAVNCLEFSSTGIVGHNTDASGYADSLSEVFGMRVWRPLILGGGGAAQAVDVGMGHLGAKSVVVARTPSKVRWTTCLPWTAEVLDRELERCNLIIDCTSVGLSAKTDGQWPIDIDLSKCSPDTVVSTLVYHREPKLCVQARELSMPTLNGMGMLIHQGLAALKIWLGIAPPAGVLHDALSNVA